MSFIKINFLWNSLKISFRLPSYYYHSFSVSVLVSSIFNSVIFLFYLYSCDLFVFFCGCFYRCHCSLYLSLFMWLVSLFLLLFLSISLCVCCCFYLFHCVSVTISCCFSMSVVVSISVIVLKLFFGRGMTLGQGPLVFIENVPRKVWRHQKRTFE